MLFFFPFEVASFQRKDITDTVDTRSAPTGRSAAGPKPCPTLLDALLDFGYFAAGEDYLYTEIFIGIGRLGADCEFYRGGAKTAFNFGDCHPHLRFFGRGRGR